MRVLSLFSGGGLGDYGLELAGMEIVGQVEIDDYCQKILKLRWPDVQKWRDVRDVQGEEIKGKIGAVDLISGGFPCQDISVSGKRDGLSGSRSGLWVEYFRLIREIRPRFTLIENVGRLAKDGLKEIISDISSIRYDCEWACLNASTFGAIHKRPRIFIVAYPKDNRHKYSVYAKGDRYYQRRILAQIPTKGSSIKHEKNFREKVRSTEFVRKSNGAPSRVDRLKLLGNGQVVQVVEWIGKRIMDFSHANNSTTDSGF